MTEVDVLEQPQEFGRELRRRRLAARLSLAQLGALVHYSKGQLSKVERGLKRPTVELARMCDARLKTGGVLSALVASPKTPARDARSSDDGEVWLMQLNKDGSSAFQPVARRQVITAGAGSVLAIGAAGLPVPADVLGTGLVDTSRALFDQFRRLGQTSGPSTLLPVLIAQTHSLEQLAARSGTRTRHDLLVLASRYAEYTGWMAQEAGQDAGALWWTERAVELATACDDREHAAYTVVRRALISLFSGDTAQASGLAEHVLACDASPRVRGIAAQHLAQSQAVEGAYDACMHSLDRARDLLARSSDDGAKPVIGASHLPDVAAMFTGWCLYELGRPTQAAETLEREISRLPAHALRTRARYGVRAALAHAAAGEIEQSCVLTRELLGSIGLVHSATIRADLRRLSRTLNRYPRHRSVRELSPDLALAASAAAA
ncbi:helix-turn-helix domain-containing protein [Streptomyces sp. HSW2009]|uniref:helix-turn-helix domain-containing protein n=1 Tax=Streptomyces sp. HSW2009 TaxID=3142890 RepID=UPI0032F0619F